MPQCAKAKPGRRPGALEASPRLLGIEGVQQGETFSEVALGVGVAVEVANVREERLGAGLDR
jgi:hypothetical protein